MALLARVPPDGDEQAVARALGFESTDSAVMALAERPTTVVLDNCEHVAGAVRRFVQQVRTAVPAALVLTTTREPLGLPGEQVYVLAPLGVNDAPSTLFLDSKGTIVFAANGGRSERFFRKRLNDLLQRQGPK